MELLYLGTAAAEGTPALFCHCPVCEHARKLGGKNIRTRSQALLDKKLMLDFPPDTYLHYLAHSDVFDLPRIDCLLVTHSHHDHFFAQELEMRAESYADSAVPMLHIYGNAAVEKKYREIERMESKLANCCTFHLAAPFEAFSVDGYTVTPLRALHDKNELCLIYWITDGKKSLLYAHDTGIFSEDTWEFLRGRHTDLVSLDCTCQSTSEGTNHMGLTDADAVRRQMLEEGMADEKTIFVLNHFSHNGLWNYDTAQEEAAKCGMRVSYDGMTVRIPDE